MDFIHELLYPSEETIRIFGGIFLVLTIISTVASGLFAVSYGLLYKWRKRSAGRATMYLVLSLFFTFLVIDLARINPDYPGRTLLTLIVYGAVSFNLIKLVATLWYWYGHEPSSHSPAAESSGSLDDTVPRRPLS